MTRCSTWRRARRRSQLSGQTKKIRARLKPRGAQFDAEGTLKGAWQIRAFAESPGGDPSAPEAWRARNRRIETGDYSVGRNRDKIAEKLRVTVEESGVLRIRVAELKAANEQATQSN